MNSADLNRPSCRAREHGSEDDEEGVAMPVKYEGYLMVLFAKDLARTRDFYRDVIGLKYKHGEEGVDAYFEIGPDGLLVISHDTADNLLSPADVDHEPAHGARSVIVAPVEDVDAAYEELRAKGVEFIRAPEDRHWGLRCAHFKDPEGNVWEIHTPVKED
jgi:lactoylglutathione lyase